MRSSFSLLVAVLVFAASGAHAQCAFDAPAKAKGLKSDMVRAYSSCPGVTFAAPNTSTMAGVPACGPPVAMSEYRFGPKGACSVRLSAKLEEPCSDGTGIPCQNNFFKAKCRGITDASDVPIESGAWTLNIVARLSTDDPSAGDVTIIDFPAQFAFSTPNAGRMKVKFESADGFGFAIPSAALPPCSSLEFLSTAVVDPDGKHFATMGSSTR